MRIKLATFLKLMLYEPRITLFAWRVKHSKKTFLSWPKLSSLVENFHILHKRKVGQSLNLCEFGVGRGGSAAILGWLAGHYEGRIILYDVFSRIPAPTKIDGEEARLRYEKILKMEDQDYYGNVPNLLEVVRSEIEKICPKDRVEIIAGRYEDVLPTQAAGKSYDLVHIDCDWYESTRVVLAYLKDHLNPGAILQIDDYGHWQGSRQAYEQADWLKQYPSRMVDDALVIDTGGKE